MVEVTKPLTLLAIETSSKAGSVALSHNDEVIERFAIMPRQHAARMLSMTDELLKSLDLTLADIDGYVYSPGPGSFTGVRVASAMIQGLHYTQPKPTLAVSMLASLAYQAYRTLNVREVLVATDARMDECYVGQYRFDEKCGDMVALVDDALISPDEFNWPAEGNYLCIGDGWHLHQDKWPSTPANLTLTYADEDFHPHAQDLLALALSRWATGDKVELALPTYYRGF